MQLQLHKKHETIINSHNEKVSHQKRHCPNEQKCNSIKKELYSLKENYQAENIA